MRKILSIAIVLTFILPTGMRWIIIANYELNKEFITSKFCENKEKVNLHCNGKCYLAKQLHKEESKEVDYFSFLRETFEGIVTDMKIELNRHFILNYVKHGYNYRLVLLIGFLGEAFRPPSE